MGRDSESKRTDSSESGPEGSGEGRISTGEPAGVEQQPPTSGYGPGGHEPTDARAGEDYAQTPNPPPRD